MQNKTTYSEQDILDIDAEHIWHPYSATPADPIFVVDSAEGCIITLKNGTQLIDGMSSWWSAIHGYNHPVLNQAIEQQIKKMSHVMFGGLTHEPAARLVKTLVDITPEPLQKVFLSDSGSIAVEVAIKMALQYWVSRKQSEKHRLLSVRGGYHGDTFATMAVCDPLTGMHHLFKKTLTEHIFADKPTCKFDENFEESHIENFKTLIESNHHELAAVIIEPIVQGTGGMHFYSPLYLKRVRELCDEFDVLLILDEIATGFGRTGKLFASEHANISADILCVGKALTGGTMTLAATLCTNHIAETFAKGESGVFMHGPTFMANPLACATANANLDLLLNSPWQNTIANIETQLNTLLAPASSIEGVSDVRVLGAIGVIELENEVDMKTIQPMFVKERIWLRPFGKLVYMMPPYVISNTELEKLCFKTIQVVKQYLNQAV